MDYLTKCRVSNQLVPCANEPPALLRDREKRLGFLPCFNEWLLDIHVRPGQERQPRGLEVLARRRADMHQVRLGILEQVRQARVRLSCGTLGECFCRRVLHVVYSDDAVRRRDSSERLEMVAGHDTGTNESDSQRHTAPLCKTGARGRLGTGHVRGARPVASSPCPSTACMLHRK